MTVRRVYLYRLSCDKCGARDAKHGTDEINAVAEAGWGYAGVAGEVTECWCVDCGAAEG